jgi:hypothetical protein
MSCVCFSRANLIWSGLRSYERTRVFELQFRWPALFFSAVCESAIDTWHAIQPRPYLSAFGVKADDSDFPNEMTRSRLTFLQHRNSGATKPCAPLSLRRGRCGERAKRVVEGLLRKAGFDQIELAQDGT